MRIHIILLLMIVTKIFVLSSCLPPPDDGFNSEPNLGSGLTGSYFDSLTGNRIFHRVDSQINFDWIQNESPGNNLSENHFSIIWTGEIKVPETGYYTFSAFLDDGAKILIDITNVLPNDAWSRWLPGETSNDRLFIGNPIILEEGTKYPIRIEFFEWDWNARIQLNWTRPDGITEIIPSIYLYPSDNPENSMPLDVPLPSDLPITNPPEEPPIEQPPLTSGNFSSQTYSYDNTNFMNPERGFHREGDMTYSPSLQGMRSQGVTLVRTYVRLDSYRNSDLPQSFLNMLNNSFGVARNEGIKIILRFSYNFGGAADASETQIIRHIQQLKPILEYNNDVIAVLQGGFVGAWGEWHSSTNDLTSNTDSSRNARENIIKELLTNLPENRMIQIRQPIVIADIYPTPLTCSQAFTNTNQARIGHKNDCFLRNPTDSGTYSRNIYSPDIDYSFYQPWKDYVQIIGNYTVHGGETCAYSELGWDDNNRLNCVAAISEMQNLGTDYLNLLFDIPSIDTWRTGGCFDEIEMRLGYRYYLVNASVTSNSKIGELSRLLLTIENRGFGKMYNPRPIDIILRPVLEGKDIMVRITEDARRILPLGGETRVLNQTFNIPSTINPGEYRIYLSLPDANSKITDDSRYSVRLASRLGASDLWTSEGYNNLGLIIQIS